MSRCLWSRNLKNEEAMTRVGLQSHRKKRWYSLHYYSSYMFRLSLYEPSSGWSIIYLRGWYILLAILLLIATSRVTYLKYCNWNDMHWSDTVSITIMWSWLSMIQYIIKIYSVKLRTLDWCSGLEFVIFYLFSITYVTQNYYNKHYIISVHIILNIIF